MATRKKPRTVIGAPEAHIISTVVTPPATANPRISFVPHPMDSGKDRWHYLSGSDAFTANTLAGLIGTLYESAQNGDVGSLGDGEAVAELFTDEVVMDLLQKAAAAQEAYNIACATEGTVVT